MHGRGLKNAAAFALLVVLAAAEAFSVTEKVSYFDGFDWAVTTITTVGYGDQLPTSSEAKVLAMIVMVVGIGFFAALAGALADRFIKGRAEELAAERAQSHADDDLLARVDALAEQVEQLRATVRARAGAPGPPRTGPASVAGAIPRDEVPNSTDRPFAD